MILMDITTSTILYFSVYSASALLFSLSIKARNGKGVCLLLALLIPVVFAGVRYNVGTDFGTYMNVYRNFSAMSFRQFSASDGIFVDLIVYIFAKIAKFLGGWQYFYGLYALSAYLPFLLLVRSKYQGIPTIILAFLYLTGMFTTGLNIMRQGTAAVIVFCSFQYVYEKNFFKFFVGVLLATLFHASAAMVLPIYFAYSRIEVNKKRWSMALLAVPLILAVVFYKDIILYLSQFPLFEKYIIYLEDGGDGTNREIFLHCLIALVLWAFKKQLVQQDERNDMLYLLVFIGLGLEVVGFEAVFVRRIAVYFYNLPSIFLIAQLPLLFKKKDYLISCSLIYIYAAILFIILFGVLKHSAILPYNILEV